MLPGASRHHGNTTGARNNNNNKPKRPTIPASSSSHGSSGRPVEDPTSFGRQVPFHCQPSPPTLSGSMSTTTLSGSNNSNNNIRHHRSASGSDYDSGSSMHHHPSYDSNIPTKDKKKTLFRFGRKKGPPTTLPQSPSSTTLQNSSTSRHRHKRSYDFDYRQPHPLDNTSNFDDRFIYHTVNGSISSGGSHPFCQHRKSPSSGYRKGKDRERSDGSLSSYTKSTRSDSGFKSKACVMK
ncbi:hypothetical protein LRAMOSA08279 [Lichtheimia ramosa]|uniref:Uncharacterized protein n=1 Tax=Lichtheimia ramosa TaxID=688394 RepID=A0A077WDK3_9FUNG|nr:hypothetical protein LRAMOSA08279 [Lichtheimia ramosa]